MAIDQSQGPSKPDKMMQIQSAQKVITNSIFDVPKDDKESTTTIHSGHFMVSRLHEEKDEDDDEEGPVFADDTKDFSSDLGYDFVQATKETSHTYHFGPKSTSTLSIDASLTKLFECMTLAYSGKITSPKWKPFRGMHLTIKDKVRLNNIIWREWHMQYIFQMKPVVCQFATPLSDYIHSKPEAVVLEGKYWKRRLDTVTKEYKRWRRYFRDRILQSMPEADFFSTDSLTEGQLLERVKEVSVMPHTMQQSSTDLSILHSDFMDMDFTDNLFSSLNQPFPFPNPRDFGQLSCADLIQPGLVQLQPNLDDDFMEIDNLQELLAVSRPMSNLSSTFTAAAMPSPLQVSDMSSSMDLSQSHPIFQNTVSLGLLDPSIFSSSNSSSNTAGINMLTALAALSSSSNNSSNNVGQAAIASPTQTVLNSTSVFSSDTQMLVDDGSSTKQSFTGQSGFLGALLAAEFNQKPSGVQSLGQALPSLTLQTNSQNIFGSHTIIGPNTPHNVELQQLLANSQQTMGHQQQTMLSQQALGPQHKTMLSQQALGPQQKTMLSQQMLGGAQQHQQQQQQQQQILGSSQQVLGGLARQQQQHQQQQAIGGSSLSIASVVQSMEAQQQTLTNQKQRGVVSQQTHQQIVALPQSIQTVNLSALGLTQSPVVTTTAAVEYQFAVSMPTAAVATFQPIAAVPSANAGNATLVKGQTGLKVSHKASPSPTVISGRPGSSGHVTVKKDVFAIPQGKPVTTPRKPRTIAPAPSPPQTTPPTSPTPSMQSRYLAQLLTEGTYPGALISIKKETPTTTPTTMVSLSTSSFPRNVFSSTIHHPTPPPPPVTTCPSHPPALTAAFGANSASSVPVSSASAAAAVTANLKMPSEITMELSKVTGMDFPTSVLLAAASSAIGTSPSSLKDVLRLNPSRFTTANITSGMSTTPATTPTARCAARCPMQVLPTPSPGPSSSSSLPDTPTTPPPSSPLTVVFSGDLSPIPTSPVLRNPPGFQQTSALSPESPQDEHQGEAPKMGVHTEQRRVAHLSAEQKRRGNLKTGFDLLHTLVPSLAQNPKVSKATMLQKTAEHCRKMKAERAQMQHEASILKQEIESLNSAITNVQAQLPETGVPVTRQRVDHMKEMFEEYVRNRTLQNWKFWIFSIIVRSLFDSYNNMVSTASVEELCRTAAAWLDQHCSLVALRPTVLNALRHLSMTTSILSDPGSMKEQATQAVTQGLHRKGGQPREHLERP